MNRSIAFTGAEMDGTGFQRVRRHIRWSPSVVPAELWPHHTVTDSGNKLGGSEADAVNRPRAVAGRQRAASKSESFRLFRVTLC
jgi:hypothetical protein